MLKILIWKQFYQTFRSYFVDNKTGKAKSKPKIIGMFVLFIFVMFSLCTMFYFFATSLLPLLDTKVSWLYYAFYGLLTLGLGIFTSLFNTANTIYNAKDNDLLLSMPIKPQYVLISRIVSIFSLCLVYSATAWLSVCLAGFIYKGFNLINCLMQIVELIAIVTLSCSISSLAGYVVANIQNKTKNKSIVTTLVSLVFLGAYYYLCFKFSDFVNSILVNADELAGVTKTWLNFIYQLGMGANGNILSFIIFVGICSIVGAACYLLLKRNFATIVTKTNNVSTTSSKIKYKSSNKISSILLRKELKRFTSSSVYMLNCGLGSIFVIVVAIGFVIKQNDIASVIDLIGLEMPLLISFIPLMIVCIVCSMISINSAAVPSISLEGKNLWIIKSLPVNSIDVLFAKKNLQLIINGIPAGIASIIISWAFKFDFNTSMYIFVITIMFVFIQSSIGILLALFNPNFNWTSETQPIKQSINVVLEMIICWILLLIMVGGYYFLNDKMLVEEYMQYLAIFLMVIELYLRRILRGFGVNKFEAL